MKFGFKKTISVMLVTLVVLLSMPLSGLAVDNVNPDMSSDVEMESANAVGNIILNSTEVKEEKEAEGYRINSVALYGNTAVANVSVKDECTVVVSIYDDEGKLMLASGKEDAYPTEKASFTEIIVNIDTDEMPEYFLVRAFLLDENYRPLCECYENIEYTEAFEIFSSKTTEDFEEDRVINLDESNTENFLVVTEDAKIIKNEKSAATYGTRTRTAVTEINKVVVDDYENGYYVIENISDDVRNLNPGEVFYYEYGEGDEEYIIALIDTIEINGTTAEIYAAAPENLTDYFQFANIDMESSESTFENGDMEDYVNHESEDLMPKARDVNINNKKSTVHKWSAKFELDDDKGELSFGVQTVLSCSFKLYIDFYIFGIRSAYTEFTIGFDSDIQCKLSVSGYKGKIPLGVIGLPTGAGITVGIVVNFVLEVDAEVEVSFKISETRVGFSLDKNGFKDKSNFSITDFNPSLGQETKLFVGLSVEPTLKATKFVEAKLSGKAGMELVGKNNEVDKKTYEMSDGSKVDAVHMCETCVDLDLGIKVECAFNIKFFKIINSSYKLLDKFIKIGDYYLSLDKGFGLGECPHYNVKIQARVTDSVGNPVAKVSVNGSMTDIFGEAAIYVPMGSSTVTAHSPLGQTGSAEVYFAPDSKIPVAEIALNNKSGVKDYDLISDDILWRLYNDGELVVEGKGEIPDFSYNNEAPWKKYKGEVKRITLADGITVIGEYAFDDFTCVGEIALPDSLTEIKYNALVCSTEKASDLALEYETEEEAIEGINKLEALLKNEDFLQLRIPENLENIDASNFSSSAFSCFVVDENNLFFSSDSNGALYNKEKTRLISYPFVRLNDEYIVPETVTQIDEMALMSLFVDKIVIPDSVEGVITLYFCLDLSELQLGGSISGFNALACISLENIDLPTSVKSVGLVQTAVESLALPSGVTDLSLAYCSNLETVYLPLTVTYVSQGALSGREIYYQGSEEDFKKIKHGDYGEVMNVKSVVYNSYFPGESSSVYARTLSNNVEINNYSNTTDYDSCVIIIVRDKDAEDLLSSDNLIYINQQAYTGEIPEFDWTLPEGEDEYYVLYTFANLDMINHKHSYDEGTVTAPTCTGKGFTTYTCACGDSFIADEVDKVPHNMTEQETVTEATCTKEGVKHIGCSECDYYEVEKIPQTNHVYNKVVIAPTCTDGGYTIYSCTCGFEYTADFTGVTDHTYSEDGVCVVCGYETEKDTCDHICHKTGIMGVIYSLIRIFWKLFKTNKICSCGINHY